MPDINIRRLRYVRPNGSRVYIHVTKNLHDYLLAHGLTDQYAYNAMHHGRPNSPAVIPSIDDGFVWSRTPEGHLFWKQHNDAYLEGKPLPNSYRYKEVI